jgi:SAM-dependent methyltransferase
MAQAAGQGPTAANPLHNSRTRSSDADRLQGVFCLRTVITTSAVAIVDCLLESQPIIDVERLTADLRQRVEERRVRGDYADDLDGWELRASPSSSFATSRVQLHTALAGQSTKPVIGPLIALLKRGVFRLLYWVLDDIVTQTNSAVANVERAVHSRDAQRDALDERFSGLDDKLSRLDERLSQRDTNLDERLAQVEMKIDRVDLLPRPRKSLGRSLIQEFPPPDTPQRYVDIQRRFVAQILDSEDVLELFRSGDPLPPQYGVGLDERVVEFPWLFSHSMVGRVLDAGSTLNHVHILDRLENHYEELHLVTLTPEDVAFPERGISYIYGDLRDLPIRNDFYDIVISISTLEHVGMDNRQYGAYGGREPDPRAAVLDAVRELKRVTRPGGLFLATVPFGVPDDLGWLRIFDRRGIDDLVEVLSPRTVELRYYLYSLSGWQVADAEAASGARYKDPFADRSMAEDLAPAARAVACIEASL